MVFKTQNHHCVLKICNMIRKKEGGGGLEPFQKFICFGNPHTPKEKVVFVRSSSLSMVALCFPKSKVDQSLTQSVSE